MNKREYSGSQHYCWYDADCGARLVSCPSLTTQAGYPPTSASHPGRMRLVSILPQLNRTSHMCPVAPSNAYHCISHFSLLFHPLAGDLLRETHNAVASKASTLLIDSCCGLQRRTHRATLAVRPALGSFLMPLGLGSQQAISKIADACRRLHGWSSKRRSWRCRPPCRCSPSTPGCQPRSGHLSWMTLSRSSTALTPASTGALRCFHARDAS